MATTIEVDPLPTAGNLRIFLRALWVARVPVASIVAAFVIFTQPEALDLFVDIPPSPLGRFLHWTAFYFAALLFWVLPANFSARVALQLNQERIGIDTPWRHRLLVKVLPRVLSILCFLVLYFAFQQASQHVPSDTGEGVAVPLANEARMHLRWTSYWALGLCVGVTLVYVALASLPFLRGRRLRPISPRLYDLLDDLLTWAKPRGSTGRQTIFDEDETTAQHNTLISVSLLLIILFAIDVLVAIVFLNPSIAAALDLESYLPRAVFIPVLLGINVPGLALLGILSHRFRAPLILAFFLSLAIWGLFWENRHNVRIDAMSSPARRISIEKAVNDWKIANSCDRGQQSCPSAIIVAGSGGASRAAFMTGTVMARLQELSGGKFGRELFAVSAISGSSLGAAAFVAALEWPDTGQRTDPCREQRFQNWFACHEKTPQASEARATTSLTQRVHLFFANDFLTPAVVTLTFSDMWRLRSDRAAKLERSWEASWREVTLGTSRGKGDFDKYLSEFLPKSDWRPLLIFNGTSVGTGRRIITSSLAPTLVHGRRIFGDAYDLYEMACPDRGGGHRCDLRLSTAVLTSARFPLISPAGGIMGVNRIVDRVVDGGYFDNFGMVTALELADAVRRLGLTPFILQITNDPLVFQYDLCSQTIDWGATNRAPELPPVGEDSNLLRWAFDPLYALLATRTAHGFHATIGAPGAVGGADNYAHVRVCPQQVERTTPGWLARIKDIVLGPRTDAEGATDAGDAFKALSASWWLSMPVQQYLYRQLEQKHNVAEIERVLQRKPAKE